MIQIIIALISGSLFATGLVISGMTDPQKVIGFLDIFGSWDMSLLFVMLGAVSFNLLTFRWLLKKEQPLFDTCMHLPQNSKIDGKLLVGAALFGIGWGLMGICPGPALVNIATLDEKLLVFVISMLIGMGLFKAFGPAK